MSHALAKLLDVAKLKAFADDKLNVAKMMTSLLDGVENTVGKADKRTIVVQYRSRTKQYRLTMKIITKKTNEVQFFYLKGR